MMGVYSLYFANAKQFKALSLFNRILLYIQDDENSRLFRDKDGKVNEEFLKEFYTFANAFRLLFGTEPNSDNENRPISYQDLRAPQENDLAKDRVYICRKVPICFAWKGYSDDYIAQKIGFLEKKPISQVLSNGQIIITGYIEVPAFSSKAPDFQKKESNCMPYSVWQDQKTKILNILIPIVSFLETKIATYLHQEGDPYEAKERIGSTKDDDWIDDDTGSELDEEDEGANEE